MDIQSITSKSQSCEAEVCLHCSEEIAPGELITNERDGKLEKFCCYGCMSVHSLLLSNNLEDFYRYQNEQGSQANSLKERPSNSKSKFEYMDSEAFIREYVTIEEDKLKVHFLLEGVHCFACIWLIERISKLENSVIEAQVNIGNNLGSFTIDTKRPYSIAKLAATLAQLGYTPHPFNIEKDQEKKLSDRRDILQIGVAASAMSNIMIYAVSNYAGATGDYVKLFDGISFAFCLPVILYSAKPILVNSVSAIRLRSTNVDIPLAMAIVFGFLLSAINFFRESGPVYFDSITTLIFLILLSRYFVKMLTQKSMSTKGISSLFLNTGVKKIVGGAIKHVFSNEVEVGDHVVFEEDERIIYDGRLASEKALILNSINTGESRPLVVNKGDFIAAGAVSLSNDLALEISAIGTQTKLGKNLSAIENNTIVKNPANVWAQKISRYFTIGIILLSIVALTQGLVTGDLSRSFEVILAILIVGCPCAFAMATPIVVATRINKLKSYGIYVKNELSLEELNNAKNIIFDKTGTLTKGKFAVSSFSNHSQMSDEEVLALTFTLERAAQHPIAFALKKYSKQKISNESLLKYADIVAEVVTGKGVQAQIDEITYFIGKGLLDGEIALYANSEVIATFKIEDSIRPESKDLVSFLQQRGIDIHLSTGDASEMAKKIASEAGINETSLYIEQSPEQKLELADKLENVVFVGDGDNDALAMIKSNVSIAIGAQADIALRSCDIYLPQEDLNLIKVLFKVARNVKGTLRRNIMFAVTYNIVGITLALMHIITPLHAAILMPISSLTVLLSSTLPLIGFDMRMLKNKGKS
ncbi:heavy metal translocating P-type ATPase [Halobacteriovorax sp. CON-3]|uniref:heavy metal translocating P-type ATPase n=1 Tax=Halobacteriovorax sp. CON-3 TaxID=3157710 RepID=UPI003714EC8F